MNQPVYEVPTSTETRSSPGVAFTPRELTQQIPTTWIRRSGEETDRSCAKN